MSVEVLLPVTDLAEGDLVDLEGCPFLTVEDENDDMAAWALAAECEYFTVVGIERETIDCVRVDFEGLSIGFPTEFRLPVAIDTDIV